VHPGREPGSGGRRGLHPQRRVATMDQESVDLRRAGERKAVGRHRAKPGDVLRFAGDVPHQYAALGDRPARAIVLMAYPSA
jgi:hypothetical protein